MTLSAFPSIEPVWSPALNETDGLVLISDAWGTGMEPAPRTPTGPDDGAWALMVGTIRGAWETRIVKDADEVEMVVAPGFSTGNT